MKYILSAIFFLLILASCTKNKKYCWRCVNTTTVTIDAKKPVVTTAKNDVCDKTEQEMINSSSYNCDTVNYGDTMTVISIFDNTCTKL